MPPFFNTWRIQINIASVNKYIYFKQLVSQIYPTELRLNKASSSDTEAPFLVLDLSITNDTGRL